MPDFTEVYREYFAGVYRYALALCGDRSLAEEITQETFFRSLSAIDGFRGDCPLSAWLCRIARNCWLDHCRDSRRRGEAPPEGHTPGAEETCLRPGRKPEPPWQAWTACRSPTARCCGSGLWGASASGTSGRHAERPRPGPGSPAFGPDSD